MISVNLNTKSVNLFQKVTLIFLLILFFHVIYFSEGFTSHMRLTACVTRLGWEGGFAIETGCRRSHGNYLKTRGVPRVGCMLCWVLSSNARYATYHSPHLK